MGKSRVQGGARYRCDSREQPIGEFATDCGADLSDLLNRSEPVQAGRQRAKQRRGNRKRRKRADGAKLITCILKQAQFQHRLRKFLDEQRNPIRLHDDLRVHFRGEGPLSGYVEYHGLDLLAPEPVKPQHGYMRLIEPMGEELRSEAHQDEYLRRFD